MRRATVGSVRQATKRRWPPQRGADGARRAAVAYDPVAPGGMAGEHPVIGDEVRMRARDERGESLKELVGREDDEGAAVSPGA